MRTCARLSLMGPFHRSKPSENLSCVRVSALSPQTRQLGALSWVSLQLPHWPFSGSDGWSPHSAPAVSSLVKARLRYRCVGAGGALYRSGADALRLWWQLKARESACARQRRTCRLKTWRAKSSFYSLAQCIDTVLEEPLLSSKLRPAPC